jgi:type IV pilus assembly protein PilN
MHIPINLASQPFRRDRAVLVGSSAAAIGLAVLLAFLLSINAVQSAKVADTRAEIARLETQMRILSSDQARQDTVLRQPENAAVLERSVFLNQILYRKGISWTRIFADLEKVIPFNVRIIAIRPFVVGQHQISLDMTVGAESVAPVIDFMKNLENSKVFGAVYSRSLQPPTQNDRLYRCRLSVNYAQTL